TYTIDFSKNIPFNYKDKIVLENLRAAYSKHIVNSDEISSEIAVADYIEELKQLYGVTIDEDLAYCMEDSEDDFDLANFLMHFHWYSNNIDTVYINNGRLIQFFSYSSDYMGGAHGAVGYKSLLYDLKEDRVVPLNDVFDRDEDEAITKLLCQEFIDEWCDYDDEDVIIRQIEEYIWKDDTDFAVAEEGIYFNYSSYALGVYAFGSPSMLITYDRLDGMLRPDTPVYDLYLKAVGK
ncbi:MAG: hypothetical protein HUJ93_06635, partial [Bacteroidales bacterium]|nr:hypothetical protein [Bacteroidales bacterium]